MKIYFRWMAVISFFILSQSMGAPLAYSQSSDATLKLLQELEALERSADLKMKPVSLPKKSNSQKPLEKPSSPKVSKSKQQDRSGFSAKPPQKKIPMSPVTVKRSLKKKPGVILAKRQYAPSPEMLWQSRRDSELHWNNGLDHWSNGDFPSAIEQFKLAMRSQPQNPHGHWNLSTLYNRIGDGMMAIYHMNIAHKIYLNDHNRKEAARSKGELNKLMKKYGYNERNRADSR